MLLAEVVHTCSVVGATSSRSGKIAALAELLERVPLIELEAVVSV
ncbi:MAG: hypothetical protein QOF81_2321, partial [Acidimicrobiaceae bacterium]|nr:hypothetical protein [Acidimicrobiaceae bacterium]